MSRPQRVILLLLLALAAAACRPSATVKRTAPIGDLRSYRTAVLRVAGAQQVGAYVPHLAGQVASTLQQQCRFDQVLLAEQAGHLSPDLLIDLNVTRSYRGGGGIIYNPNLAVMEALLVLSAGPDEELVGSAWIKGKSSGVAVGNTPPEMQAATMVANSVAEVLTSSGCSEARVVAEAPAEPGPATPGVGGTATATPTPATNPKTVSGPADPKPQPEVPNEDRTRAEALNDEGKKLFRTADIAGAAERFKAAIALLDDPRYYFNLCFAYESLERFDEAISVCEQVLTKNPDERLVNKTRERIGIIHAKRGS